MVSTAMLLAACHMEAKLEKNQEEISQEILAHRFRDIDALTRYLNKSGVEYILKEESIAKESPDAAKVAWSSIDSMYYLVLLPGTPNQLYRFRVYPKKEGGLHLEKDFGYKNPYQQ
jgi:hypothetical protein